jgi:hypothetical protein
MRSGPLIVCTIGAALAAAGCGGGGGDTTATEARPAPKPATGAAPWPAPPDPIARTRLAGLKAEEHEFVNFHVHAHLDMFVNGSPTLVPAGIGIAVDDPAVHRFKAPDGTRGYGGIDPPCMKPCISPLHTHFDDGILHTEAKKNRPNTLGEFFTQWNVRLDGSCVGGYCRPQAPIAVYVDGQPTSGDPRQIELTDGKEIAIVIGTPPAEIPSSPSGG